MVGRKGSPPPVPFPITPSQKVNTHILVTHTHYFRDILTNRLSLFYISLQYIYPNV